MNGVRPPTLVAECNQLCMAVPNVSFVCSYGRLHECDLAYILEQESHIAMGLSLHFYFMNNELRYDVDEAASATRAGPATRCHHSHFSIRQRARSPVPVST